MSVMWWNFIDWEWRENKPIITDLRGYKACKDRKHGLCPFVFVVVKETGNQGGEWKQWVQFFFFSKIVKMSNCTSLLYSSIILKNLYVSGVPVFFEERNNLFLTILSWLKNAINVLSCQASEIALF